MTDLPQVPDAVVERIEELWGFRTGRSDTEYVKDVLQIATADPAFQRHMVDVLKASGLLIRIGQYNPEFANGGIHHGNRPDYPGYKSLFYFEDKS